MNKNGSSERSRVVLEAILLGIPEGIKLSGGLKKCLYDRLLNEPNLIIKNNITFNRNGHIYSEEIERTVLEWQLKKYFYNSTNGHNKVMTTLRVPKQEVELKITDYRKRSNGNGISSGEIEYLKKIGESIGNGKVH